MIETTILSNGLTLLTERMANIRSVSIGVWLRKGSRHEEAAENGISHFLEHLVFKGTEKRTTAEIARAIDSIGGQMDAFTTKEYTCFYAKVLDEHLPVAVDLLSDILLHPLFEANEIERERKVIFEEIRMVEDTPDELIYDLFSDYFWPGHPLGRPIQGTADTVRSMNRDRLKGFFEESYQPGQIIISAAGNLEHADLAGTIGEAFEPLPDRSNHLPEQVPSVRRGIVVREKSELEQLHVCLGLKGYPQNHPRRFEWHVLNTLLGGSMSSRLFQNIREKRGLAYSIYSSVNAFRDTGNLMVSSATSPDSGEEVVRLIVEEFRKLKSNRVDPEELKGQGKPQGQPHAEPGEQFQPDVESGPAAHLLRSPVVPERNHQGHRGGGRGSGSRPGRRASEPGTLRSRHPRSDLVIRPDRKGTQFLKHPTPGPEPEPAQVEVRIRRRPGNADLPLPALATSGSVGFDLAAAVEAEVRLGPGERVTVPTGFEIALPPGYEAQLRPRSGLAQRRGLTLLNTPGTIDWDYRGEIRLIVINHGADEATIRRGDRIAQMVIHRVPRVRLVPADELPGTGRGAGGFGHSGEN
jgi:deoxyuridine 5'-triphosphate nucleotidohydrolase